MWNFFHEERKSSQMWKKKPPNCEIMKEDEKEYTYLGLAELDKYKENKMKEKQ